MVFKMILRIAFKILCACTLLNCFPSTLLSAESLSSNVETSRIVFLMQSGKIDTALQAYREYYQKIGQHDYDVIQKIGLCLLERGSCSKEPEVQLLTIFGAGISMNEKVLYILEDGLKSPIPQLQLVAMNFLSRFQDDRADDVLARAMRSDSLVIRLEGAYFLAERGVPTALAQTESLMNKLDKQLWPLFPQIYAKIGSADAIKILRKLMTNTNEQVRIAAILSAAQERRDDLLPNIRLLASHHNLLQQEACAKALGVMKDEISIPKLEALTRTNSITVRLAAQEALYKLGRHEAVSDIVLIAQNRNLFAINMLGQISGSENILLNLTQDNDLQVRVNATLALLELQDPRCLPSLREILVKNARDLAFLEISSPGMALSAYKVVPSARQNLEDDSESEEISLHIREQVLQKAQKLPEKDFLVLAKDVFESQQNDLVPALTALLESLQSSGAIELLKSQQLKTGAPLIRNYCALALYRLKEKGPYKEQLQAWVSSQHKEELIRLRPVVPWDLGGESGSYAITPEETSRLLIDVYESLTEGREDHGVDILLNAIQYGNSNNKYALAGLLIRAL